MNRWTVHQYQGTLMDDCDFRALVQEMMDAQADYFEARRKKLPDEVVREKLIYSKVIESTVKAELRRGPG
jgi:hypothetical protein